jgi:hypothetical protein
MTITSGKKFLELTKFSINILISSKPQAKPQQLTA